MQVPDLAPHTPAAPARGVPRSVLPEEAPRGRGAPSLRSQCPTPASETYLPHAEARHSLAAAAQSQWRPMRSVPAQGEEGKPRVRPTK